ncbi:MAG: response regulator [Candidatus Polarisedimenticolaceae bacterium]|nr:response regulator [Candidatus Polarisedimenticolaceae bacterium]
MRILLTEDDPILGEGIYTGLKQEGYTVDWVKNATSADELLQSECYDVAILDLGLPDISGLELLKRLRARQEVLPVLILTARDTIADRVEGLDSGADDYMIKPFDLDELSARLRVLIRRSGGRASNIIEHDALQLDPASHNVTLDGVVIDISPREFSVLQMLLENIGRVLSRSRLEEGLYSWHTDVESNAIEVHIHHLRKKLGPKMIRTIRGVGYIIDKAK